MKNNDFELLCKIKNVFYITKNHESTIRNITRNQECILLRTKLRINNQKVFYYATSRIKNITQNKEFILLRKKLRINNLKKYFTTQNQE